MSERRRDPQAAFRLPSPIGGDIRGAVPPDLGPVRRILGVWNETVGAGLARFAQPARITREGVLIVHASDASWVHAIMHRQKYASKSDPWIRACQSHHPNRHRSSRRRKRPPMRWSRASTIRASKQH